MVTPSAAEEGGDYTPPKELDPVLVSMDQVRDVADAMAAHYNDAGYAYTALDFDTRIVTLYYKGTPPEDALAAQAPNADGVRVEIVPTKYSEPELHAGAQALMDTSRLLDGPLINTIFKNKDYSGLIANVDPKQLEAATALINDYQKAAGVPVEIGSGQAVDFQTRRNDSSPWQGGGQLHFPGTNLHNVCTSGFSVLTTGGEGRLLTAGHCKLNGENEATTRVNDGGGDLIANNGDMQWAPNYDSLLIDPPASPATIGKVFGGPWDAGTGNARYQFHVGGSAAPSVGDTVCVSGANTGERCNRTITNTGVEFNCPGTTTNCSGFVYSGSGVTTTGGDSGAPVYVERADGSVGARGIHSGGLNSVSCPSDTAGFEAGSCSSISIAVGIQQLTDRWNVVVEQD